MKEIEALVSTLCLSGQYGTLYRVLKPIDGAYRILASEKPAEQKRRELLELLKKQRRATG